MTNKEFFNAYCGKPVLYKGKDIGATIVNELNSIQLERNHFLIPSKRL